MLFRSNTQISPLTGVAEPVWPTVVGQTVQDSGVTWRNAGAYIPQRSIQPDWQARTLKNIPPFGDLYNTLKVYLSQFKGYATTANDAITTLLNTLINKLNTISNSLTRLNNNINTIVNALGASGVYYLDIPASTGGNQYLINSLSDPQFNSLTQNKYSAMVLIVAGGSTGATLIANIKRFLQ